MKNSNPLFISFIVIIFLLLVSTGQAQDKPAPATPAQDKPTVIAQDLGGSGLKMDWALMLRFLIDHELELLGEFKVITRDQMREKLGEDEFQAFQDCPSVDCMLSFNDRLGADKIVTGQTEKIDEKNCKISISVFDVKTKAMGKAAARESKYVDKDLFAALALALEEAILSPEKYAEIQNASKKDQKKREKDRDNMHKKLVKELEEVAKVEFERTKEYILKRKADEEAKKAAYEQAKQEEADKLQSTMVKVVELYWIDRYEYPNEKGAAPLANITWSEAAAKCAEQGKRICSKEEWLTACGGIDNLEYTYAPAYQEGKCRSGLDVSEGASKSGDYPECTNPLGTYDMVGNLWEWTGAVKEEAGIRGGAWYDKNGCGHYKTPDSTAYKSPDTGFRCCKDAVRKK